MTSSRTRARHLAPPLALAALGMLAASCGTESAAAESSGPAAQGKGVAVPAPVPGPACPESGVRITETAREAAMGLRVLSLSLTNCGTAPVEVNGYPVLTLLDEERQPLDIEIVHGSEPIAMIEGFDDGPVPLTLQPGEQASAGLVWRNTVTGWEPPVNAPFLDIAVAEGEPTRTVALDGAIDLGTTGMLGVSAWGPSAQ
ncbi:DUF4232 domain-containing protein [Streptomyces litchfieldiae]|uniref:DUF4232 domain-containing protein n=1 Tax=Streptomyces litchfieldiae TaxID=3075543 RepID=A0ABU2MJP6_9ACTN|nr:DUF4232 domain-containing protein [Streptomyces sp. DSM 44938]MDT0341825.1 DUF4232 domain-containing protein [Streptomyces sp. DSM 44938]